MPVDYVDVHVGKRLRRLRRRKGLTQQQLAEPVGVKFQQIQKYECGANRLTASKFFALSTMLGVDVNYFFEGLSDGKETRKDEPSDLFERQMVRLTNAFQKYSEKERKALLDMIEKMAPTED